MPATWLEIADTTVKIGLGALISGASAYFLARHNHSSSIEKEYISKHRAVLEQVSLDVEEMTHALLKYWSFILEWARNEEKRKENNGEKSEAVRASRAEVFTLFKGLSTAEGKLFLIGCDDQQKCLREYGERITEFYQYASRNNDQMQSSEIERWRVDLLDSRQKLYSSLSVAYKRAKI
ncbi:hypothetical protein [Pseudomonas sp.]|uniref:hypothetical protein n=1 Tax=Pseudomonas sp. TaxID=306 RepID=UPI003242BD45